MKQKCVQNIVELKYCGNLTNTLFCLPYAPVYIVWCMFMPRGMLVSQFAEFICYMLRPKLAIRKKAKFQKNKKCFDLFSLRVLVQKNQVSRSSGNGARPGVDRHTDTHRQTHRHTQNGPKTEDL